MDLTNTVWRDCLQQHTHLKQSKQQILKPVSSATPFQKSCFEVYESIKTFEKFLDENRNKYLNIGHSLSKGNDMTERDRDEIDREAQLYIDETNRRLNQIRKILVQTEQNSNPNILAHNQGILYHLADYLEHVSERLTKQRILRFEQQMAEASRVPTEAKSAIPALQGETSAASELQLDEALTRELRHENVQLQKELDDTVDQVREVEAQVVAISQAHQLLADNLMKQKDNIHQISKQAIDARKSVLRGNKELVKASRRGVDFRIFVLLFLLLLSFTLLFLHWVQS